MCWGNEGVGREKCPFIGRERKPLPSISVRFFVVLTWVGWPQGKWQMTFFPCLYTQLRPVVAPCAVWRRSELGPMMDGAGLGRWMEQVWVMELRYIVWSNSPQMRNSSELPIWWEPFSLRVAKCLIVNVSGLTEAWSWEGSQLTYRQLQTLSLDTRGTWIAKTVPRVWPWYPRVGRAGGWNVALFWASDWVNTPDTVLEGDGRRYQSGRLLWKGSGPSHSEVDNSAASCP